MQCWVTIAKVMHEHTRDFGSGLAEARGLGLLEAAALWLAGALRPGLTLARGLMLEDTLALRLAIALWLALSLGRALGDWLSEAVGSMLVAGLRLGRGEPADEEGGRLVPWSTPRHTLHVRLQSKSL